MNQNTKEGPFGFYCPQTKMFYSVPNEEVYNELMTLMRQGAFSKENTPTSTCAQANKEVDLNEHYSKLMDQDIEEIYRDPLFTKEIDDLQLKEYDFWYFFFFQYFLWSSYLNSNKQQICFSNWSTYEKFFKIIVAYYWPRPPLWQKKHL